MEEAVSHILKLIDAYHKDLRPRYVTSLNSSILCQVHSWNWGQARYPELLHILREAPLSTTASLPLSLLNRCLGEPLPERITPLDLFAKLAETLGERKQSCYLLGGTEKILKLCNLYLQASYPDLKITGTSFTAIDTEGKELHHAEEKDMLLVEQINRAAPDVLFLNLGDPKQEIWYQRVKNRLHVPVTIGVGDAFERLTGIKPRAPQWMQRLGLDWVHKLFYHPSQICKSVYNLLKFTYMAIPLVIYHNFNRLLFWLFHRKKSSQNSPTTQLFISPHQTIAVVKLPSRLDSFACREIGGEVDDLFSQDAILFDFQAVRHIDATGMGLLVRIWQRALREKKQLYSFDISADMVLLMRLHRIYDLVRDSHCAYLQDLVSRLGQHPKSSSFYDSIVQDHYLVMISFFGRLDHDLDVEAYLRKIEPIIHQKECYLDFTYCTYIDNRAIGFLAKLAEKRLRQQVSLKLVGVSPHLKRQLRIAKVASLFEFQ